MTQEVAAQPRRFWYGWVLIPVLMVFSFTQYSAWLPGIGPSVDPISKELGLSRAVVAGAYGFAGVWAFGSPLFGWLMDRLGPRYLLTLAGFLVGLGALSNSLTGESIFFWYAGWSLTVGTGGVIGGYLGTSKVVSNWFVKNRGFAIGLLTFSGAFVYMTATIHATLVENLGWRASWQIWGIAVWVITMPLAFFLVRNYPEELGYRPDGARITAEELQAWRSRSTLQRTTTAALAARAAATGDIHFTIWDILRRPTIYIMGFTAFSAAVIGSMQTTQMVPYVEGLGISKVLAAAAFGTFGLVGAPFRWVVGWAMDRLGKQSGRFFWSSSMFLTSLGVIILIFAKDMTLVWVFAIVYGVGLGMRVTAPIVVLPQYFGAGMFGSAYGVYLFMSRIGSIIGPPFAGYIYDVTGSYTGAFWIGAVLILFGGAAILFAVPPKVPATTAPRPSEGGSS